MNTIRTATTITTLGLVAAMMAGCASAAGSTPDGADVEPTVTELRLGYFANVTHAPALVGLEEGLFEDALGDVDVDDPGLQRRPRRDRGAVGRRDRRHLHRPEPVDQHVHPVRRRVGAHRRRRRDRRRGARRARRDRRPGRPRGHDARDAAARQHAGCRAAQLARRRGLRDRHLGRRRRARSRRPRTRRRSRCSSRATIDGAWLPEPWVSRLILDAGAHVLVDEADLWEDGEFPTTVLLVRAEFLERAPRRRRGPARGPRRGRAVDRRQPRRGAGRDQRARSRPRPASRSPTRSSTRALEHVTFSVDPHADTFETLVENGLAAGTQKEGSIDGLFDLRLLNGLLEASGAETVSAAGLGED